MTRDRWAIGVAYLALLLLTIVAANETLERFGFWQLGWLLVPSGSLFAGLAFSLRDGLHETLGRWWVLLAIVLGTVLSAIVAPALALASGTAFAISELCDLAVYTPLRERHRLWAVRLSGLVGSVVDSWLFLWLAPFPVTAQGLVGVVVAKAVVVEVTVWLVAAYRRREPVTA